ncbi:MAG: tryptophan synthase subunit alpha [Halanaerobiales bacterium]
MDKFKDIFKQKVLIPYITAGDPDLETTEELVQLLDKSGADIIEIGIPFSDPLADGPVIQAAGQRALASGTTLSGIIHMVSRISDKINTPLLLMGYYNSILKYGKNKFIKDAVDAGISGVIIPDLPHDEDPNLYNDLEQAGLIGVLFVTPVTSIQRLQEISEMANGFVYCVSLLGITGSKQGPVQELEKYLGRVRKYITETPLCLGFGIDGPEKAEKVKDFADGIIIGSAIVNLINDNRENKQEMKNKLKKFVEDVKSVL